ncbi:hypothetical protein KUTeg_019562 [Tegillarca granosa]|uniref:Deoxynucleoside kinase domain-containing protein n=1 Tax=Tegillarca granosa TaxID=220873 RepID=A0ABQ9EFE9_TEGGR|nr:hypothetical protein KUTeg_019562 [Tegillarca granosa]
MDNQEMALSRNIMLVLSGVKSTVFCRLSAQVSKRLISNEAKLDVSSRMKTKQTFSMSKKLKIDNKMSDQANYEKKPDNKKNFTVCVEGNIASGKTTFLEYFKPDLTAEVIEEPVSKWRNVQGHNLLAKMYEDPNRWSLTLQTYVQLTMLQSHVKEQSKPVKLMERSIFSAKYCFVENLHQSGKMPDFEYVVLTEWFDWLIDYHQVNVDLIVYLQTSPEVVHERIRQRCRDEEQLIPLEYLRNLHELHEDWLVKQTKYKPKSEILILDGDNDLDKMLEIYKENRKKILCENRVEQYVEQMQCKNS